MTDDLVRRVDSLVVLLNMERKKSLSLGKHIEKLEAALRTVKEWHGYGLPLETTRIIDAALEGKDD